MRAAASGGAGAALVFLLSGVFTTVGSQFLSYQGAAAPASLLLLLPTYLGMALGGLQLRPRRSNKPEPEPEPELGEPPPPARTPKPTDTEWLVLASALLDFFGSALAAAGLVLAGSGLFQVAYSSVTVFAALLTRAVRGAPVSRDEWVGIGVTTLALALSARGNSDDELAWSTTLGVLLTLLGAFSFGCNYVVAELLAERAIDTHALCGRIGGICLSLLTCWQLAYTLPHWDVLVATPMRVSGADGAVVLAVYALVTASQLLHAKTYYVVVREIGAVGTGVCQALRAVGVFFLSDLLYCSYQTSQCLTAPRVVSAVLVTAGILYYTWARARRRGFAFPSPPAE